MKCEVVPSEVSTVVKFTSPSHSSYINENSDAFGQISKNGLWLYVVRDTVVDVYSAESGKWQGGHCFAESLHNPSAKITAAVECVSSHVSFPCLVLAVQQDHESLVCMFDVSLCKVSQAVLVPDRVTSLDVVSGNGGVCIETHNLCRRLRCMFGVVAVGTHHGHVFLLDLCLDEDFGCSELLPNITAVVKKDDFSPQKREMALARKQHIFLHLNEESTSGSSFEFKSRSSILDRFANGDVSVTAVKYIQSLTTLMVGFNFGGIQLWDLHTLMLQFTISDEQRDQAIVSFAFQEPENDPRHFCYVWVVKGHSVSEEDLPSSISVATLYSLTYFKRDFRDGFGVLYSELQTCNKRFELPLASTASNLIGSRLLACQVISQKDNDSECVSEDMSVCFLSWEVWTDAEHQPPSYHLAVFDLNQWYQAHMPFNFRCNIHELNSYLGIFSLDEVSRKFNDDCIMGLYTVPQSVKKFKSVSVSEEFFYPSSLGFHLLCFSDRGQCKATYFGFQRHLLFEIAELGPRVLMSPKETFGSLVKSGLVSDLHGGVERTPLSVQKEAILQLALEYYLPFFFMKCLKEWRYSDSIHEGCTSKAILGWAWKKVITIKNSIDRLCIPLFNCSGADIDKASLKYLYSFRRQLTLIDSIIEGYQKYVTPRTEQGIEELHCRKYVISSIVMYVRVLLWLRSVHVLPEVCEEEATSASVVYRPARLEESFSLRRSRLQKLHSSLSSGDVFLIDGMVAECGVGSSWLEKNGTGSYPPPSVYAALGSYLLDGVELERKHALFFYLLLDLRDMNPEGPFPTELKKFPLLFGMSEGMVKLVKGFWYLDRKDSESALRKLLHPSVRASDVLPWQHKRIIKSLLCWREPQKALKYVLHVDPPHSTLEDMKLHLSVLLACGAINQAYEYQRRKQLLGFGNELLNHLFIGCQEMQKLKDLMNLPLNSFESSELVKFLSESEDPRSQESLVIYHLLHCNLFEAAKVNEKLSRMLMNKLSSVYEATIYERSVDREALVESLMAAISKPEKCLMEEMKHLPAQPIRMQESSQPLSVSVKVSAVKPMSYSGILKAMLQKSFTSQSVSTPTSANSSASCYRDLPFIGPPVTPECVKQHQVSLRSVPKRIRLSSSPTEFSSPAKRTRLLDTVPFNASSPLTKSCRKTPKHLAGDVVSLLQTPPVHRRSSGLKLGSQATPSVTPQSILKKKTEKTLQFHLADTPPLLSEDESFDEVMNVDEKQSKSVSVTEVETPSRQIRFDLPDSPDQAPSPKPNENVRPVSYFSERGEATRESPSKPLPNLTREPLRGRDISFREEEPARVPVMFSAIYTVPTLSFVSDSGIATPTQTSPPVPEQPSDAPKEDPVSDTLPSRLSYSTPKPVARSNSFSTPFEEAKLGTESSLDSHKKSLSSDADKNAEHVQHQWSYSTPSAHDPLVSSAAEEHSEDEMFYSPSTDNLEPQSFTFSNPTALFSDAGDRQPLAENAYFIEADSFAESFNESYNAFAFSKPSDDSPLVIPSRSEHQSVENETRSTDLKPSRKTFVFSRNVPADVARTLDADVRHEKEEGGGKSEVESSFVFKVSSSVEKMPRKSKTFIFGKSFSPPGVESRTQDENAKLKQAEKSEVDSSLQIRTQSLNETVKTGGDDDGPKAETSFAFKVPHATEKMPRKSRTFVFGKDFTDREIESQDENINVLQVEKVEVDSSFIFKTPLAVKPPARPSFSILSSIEEGPRLDADAREKSNNASKSGSTKTDEKRTLQSFNEESASFENDGKSRRKTFVFTRSSAASEGASTQTSESKEESASFQNDGKSRRKTFVFTRSSAASEGASTQTSESKEESASFQNDGKSRRKTFVFTRSSAASEGASTQTSESKEDSEKGDESEFTKAAAETYEEFSCSLKTKGSDEGLQHDDRMTSLSSPCADFQIESAKVATSSPQALSEPEKKKIPKKKRIVKEKVSKGVGTTPSLTKKKTKGQLSQRIEFSFAEPTSPATPEMLAALAQSPESHPLPSFLFSPPLTRGRLRKKKLDESSFCSEASSFVRPKTPPVDPLLQGIRDEKTLAAKKATKRKGRKPRLQSQLDFSDMSFASNASLSESYSLSPSKRNSSTRDTSMRHSMVLRQAKHKPDTLF